MTKTDVVDLDSSNFDSIALDKTKDVLVEFYAPCKNTHAVSALLNFPICDNLTSKGDKDIALQDDEHITLELLSLSFSLPPK